MEDDQPPKHIPVDVNLVLGLDAHYQQSIARLGKDLDRRLLEVREQCDALESNNRDAEQRHGTLEGRLRRVTYVVALACGIGAYHALGPDSQLAHTWGISHGTAEGILIVIAITAAGGVARYIG